MKRSVSERAKPAKKPFNERRSRHAAPVSWPPANGWSKDAKSCDAGMPRAPRGSQVSARWLICSMRWCSNYSRPRLPTWASEAAGETVALVAHGGYGRRDVAPFSDIDLMLLHSAGAERQVAPLAQRMVRDLFDAGLVLGQSVRTPAQACQLARKDTTICTSLAESRLLAGSETVYGRFLRRFRRQSQRRAGGLMAAIELARRKERLQYGETVYLLEPNVKRSRGGLRDIQLLRWIGFVRFGLNDPDSLRLQGVLTPEDHDAHPPGAGIPAAAAE